LLLTAAAVAHAADATGAARATAATASATWFAKQQRVMLLLLVQMQML